MSEITNAMRQLCESKGLSYEVVLETIESALSAAYRKDFGSKNQNIKVIFDPETAKSDVFDIKTVVEDLPPEELETDEDSSDEKKEKLANKDKKNSKTEKKESQKNEQYNAINDEEERKFNSKLEIQLSDALLIKKDAKLEDEIKIELDPPSEYGRMAAQTAKQVIIQKIREAERNMIINEFKEKEGEVLVGVVQRQEGKFVLIDLGKSVGILPTEEQIHTENYSPGTRVKVYVKSVDEGARGPEIILSRTSEEIIRQIFQIEVPEISNELIEIKNIAREAGSRAKVAVLPATDNIDPIGSCVGQRGSRIQTIIQELGGEKVDIIEYDENPEKYISNSLSPAKIISIDIDNNNKKAIVKVTTDQQSLAIGKGGQNVRLAARLTGWGIDIVSINPNEVSKSSKDEEKEKDNKKENKAISQTKPNSDKKEKKKDELKKDKSTKTKDKKEEKKDLKKTNKKSAKK